jgi:2'-hydroxyisoflavone reductase
MHRRQFLHTSAALVAALSSVRIARATTPKRILVLGGTSFLGPAIVEAGIAEGHTVTLFNRGVTNAELFPRVEKLKGFRSSDPGDQDLSALMHRHFDVAIDVWVHDPAIVESAARALADRVGHYVFVSSIAAYSTSVLAQTSGSIDETAPLEPWHGTAGAYNRGKAESERRLLALLGNRLTIVRPGPIKGDRDTTPDLLAWLVRAQHGGVHIGPGSGEDSVELVDVKDVARFIALAIDRPLHGTFNLSGRPMRFRQFLDACTAAMRSDARFEWIPQEFLHQHGLETSDALGIFGGNFPMWRPAGAKPGLYRMSSEKAFRAGWHTRPFEETAFDCLGYYRTSGAIEDWSDYLSPDSERAVLAAWAHRGT